jgi:hypothetical protein
MLCAPTSSIAGTNRPPPRSPLGEWGKYLGDATLAAAILDRLAMTSIRIDIDGPSYRDHLAKQRAKDRGIVDDAA